MKKVCPINATWICVFTLIIPGLVLHAEDPHSTHDQAPSTAPVPPALHHALASSLGEATSMGAKAIPTPPTGSWGIVSEGDGGGGIFRDSDSEAEAWLGVAGYGVMGFGGDSGGYFADSDATSWTYVGYGGRGIEAYGTEMGGYFKDIDGTGYAYVGIGDNGIQAYGDTLGGAFADANASGFAYAGWGDEGILASGNLRGGSFFDGDSSGYAYVGYGDRGIEAYGTEMGGYFKDIDNSGYGWIGYEDYGIQAFGNVAGGYFKASEGSGYANVGFGDRGIEALGTEMGGYFAEIAGYSYAHVGHVGYGIEGFGVDAGGYFEDINGSGNARVGTGDWGIWASGNAGGGYFFSGDDSTTSEGYAYLGLDDFGISAFGTDMGGYFRDESSSAFARVAHSSYKIIGVGTVSFVQNHPYDPSSVIVYAAPEGDEVATYTRGTARLVNGEATVPLGETFEWVTNPDLGLTAFLTPVTEWCDLYVVEQATDSILVRSRDGSDCGFNYMVYGLRIGFEELSIVQEKEQESYIPSMADHRQLYERRPDLKSYNSLERFKGMHQATSPKAKLNLSRAQALRDAIIEFDPAIHELPRPPGFEKMPVDILAIEESHRESVHRVRAARGDHDRQSATDKSDLSAPTPLDGEANIYSPSFRPPSREVATLVDVSESVEPGDVLVIDRGSAGLMRRGFEGHDSGVVGVVLDSRLPALSGKEVEAETALHAEVATTGIVTCKVDATFGAIWPGNLLVTSPTPGHAMRTDSPLPGTIVGKALEPLEEGVGAIKVLVMLR